MKARVTLDCPAEMPQVCAADYKFEIGKAYEMRPGKDATIMAIGVMMAPALEAAAALAKENINSAF